MLQTNYEWLHKRIKCKKDFDLISKSIKKISTKCMNPADKAVQSPIHLQLFQYNESILEL